MTHVATLISSPAAAALSPALVAAARERLGAGAPVELTPGVAADLPFFLAPGADPRPLADALRALMDGAPVDVAVQPVAHRRKKLLIADMDSTMIGQECIDELAAEIGIKDRIVSIAQGKEGAPSHLFAYIAEGEQERHFDDAVDQDQDGCQQHRQ